MAQQDKNTDDLEEELDLENLKKVGESYIYTHDKINHNLCGEIVTLDEGYVELELLTTKEMVADDMGLVHGGFIFSAADYAAMVAVNQKNVVLVASECQFLSPVKVGDTVTFKARLRNKDGRKRNVEVDGFVYDIKVFSGIFKTVITERHVLRLKLLEAAEQNR